MYDNEYEYEYEYDSELTQREIDDDNQYQLKRYRDFRRAADVVTTALHTHSQVAAISLIGSTAQNPYKEVPRFSRYRRARIEIWHECKDVDLAVWLYEAEALNGLRRANATALRKLFERESIGVAHHQVDIFLLAFETDEYLGRLCNFGTCPKGKWECEVPGCGRVEFLRQHEEFTWRDDSVSEENSVRLFDRDTGVRRLAADLWLPDK